MISAEPSKVEVEGKEENVILGELLGSPPQ